jgi:hypothetical protein
MRRSEIAAAVTLSDSSFLVLYGQDREVVIVGPDLSPVRLIELRAEGPDALDMPSGAALLGDSLLSVADQTRMRLKIFDLDGRERETIPLDFAPLGLWRAGERLLITPFVIGNHPRTLLHVLDGSQPRELPVPAARYSDGMVTVMANTASVAHFPDGRIVLTRVVVIPFAHVLTMDSAASAEPTRIPLPLPDGVRDRYGWLPTSRVTQADGTRLLFGAIASAPDETTGDLIYLTKTGRTNDDGGEKAIVRVDSELRYRRSYLLDVNARHMVFLAGQGISLVANMEDEWHSCSTP